MELTAPPRTPPTTRGQERRERLLNAAAELVATRGFHAVGVADIGAAAGVTGAAIYRHFGTKTDVLVALFDRVVDELLDGARQAAAAGHTPGDTLATLVAAHVEFALRDRSVLAVYGQEAHNLRPEDRRRLRRKQRRYVEIWRAQLVGLDPALPEARALARVEAVFGLLNSVPNLSPSVPDDELRRELCRMALAALTA